MDGCNWNCKLKKQDDSKCLFQRTIVPLKIINHCKRPSKKITALLKCMASSTFLKYFVYTQFTAASSLLKNTVSIEDWMAATIFVK